MEQLGPDQLRHLRREAELNAVTKKAHKQLEAFNKNKKLQQLLAAAVAGKGEAEAETGWRLLEKKQLVVDKADDAKAVEGGVDGNEGV